MSGHSARFMGFPSALLRFQGQVIFRQQGVIPREIPREVLAEAIRESTKLYDGSPKARY